MGTSYGQQFVGVEARGAIYIRKNASSPVLYRRGIWSDGNFKRADFSENPFMNVAPFSFCITIKRLAVNANNYGGIDSFTYHTGASDNFYFGLQRHAQGNNGIQIHLRLNDYSTVEYFDLNVGATTKIVGTYDGTNGNFWRGTKTTLITKTGITRPLNLRPHISIDMINSDFEITNVAWWTRVLTTEEKDAYFDNTMTIFQ